jgi:hypothetical protein
MLHRLPTSSLRYTAVCCPSFLSISFLRTAAARPASTSRASRARPAAAARISSTPVLHSDAIHASFLFLLWPRVPRRPHSTSHTRTRQSYCVCSHPRLRDPHARAYCTALAAMPCVQLPNIPIVHASGKRQQQRSKRAKRKRACTRAARASVPRLPHQPTAPVLQFEAHTGLMHYSRAVISSHVLHRYPIAIPPACPGPTTC